MSARAMHAASAATAPARPRALAEPAIHRGFEADADRAADAVSAGRAAPGRAPAQRTAGPGGATVRLGSAGAPLAPAFRRTMEDRFGADFSTVRVHADDAATRATRRMGAQAVADGETLLFDRARYRPQSRDGQHLIAHELAHVLQQRGGAPGLQRKPAPDPLTYDPTSFTIAPPSQKLTLAEAQSMTQAAIKDGKLSAATVSGAKPGSDEEIMLHYILAAASGPARWGTEIDLVTQIGFPPAAGGTAPVGKVTVRIDAKGAGEAVLVSTGAVLLPATFTTREDAVKKLKGTYGIAEVKDAGATWTVEELNIVLGALARLPGGDASALKGVVLERVATLTDSGQDLAGEFETSATGEGTLSLADEVFPAKATNFVGGGGNEASAAYLTILHEVGHAVENKAKRDAMIPQAKAADAANALVEPQNEAVETEKGELDSLNALVDEFNALTKEAQELQTKLGAAKKSGDTAAAADAKTALDSKLVERTAKGKEVAAQRAKFNSAKSDEQSKTAKLNAAKNVATAATAKTTATTARATLLARAGTAGTAATAALARAKGTKAAQTVDSEAYRTAAADAGTALAALATAVKKDADASDARATAESAVQTVEQARDALEQDHPDDGAVKVYQPVAQAQRGWLDALVRVLDDGGQTGRVRKFIDFVTAKKIAPFTKYAADNWPDKPGEFFAEAYSLFLSDPEYLKANSAALYGWFQAGSYR